MRNTDTPRQAIALKYDGTHAPTLTAKGDEALAEAILQIARDYEVPIYENAELVKLLARMELGESIPEELYRTIAEIIAFAWNLKGKFRMRRGWRKTSQSAGMITETSRTPSRASPLPLGLAAFTQFAFYAITCGSESARDQLCQFLCSLRINSASAWVNPQD